MTKPTPVVLADEGGSETLESSALSSAAGSDAPAP